MVNNYFVLISRHELYYIGMDTTRQLADIERSARQGDYGAWRKEFCRKYREVMTRICRTAVEEQRAYIVSVGATASCHKGCVYCCSHYVSVSLAHGLVITDYLYTHPELQGSFLRRYDKWRRATEENVALQELEQYTTFSPTVRRTPQALLDDYAKLNVPCPFLTEKACSIYPVRPICCASYTAISPPDYCQPDCANLAVICEAVPSVEGLRELAMLGERALTMHQESLPSLVYRLLTEGLPEVMRKLDIMSHGL